jgi:threonine/homoserine/homoserine lactone efflux protein
MPIPSRIWEFLATSIVIILAPGPSVLFIIARAIAWGRRTALFTVIGGVSGAFMLSALVAVGLGPLLQRSNLAYSAIQWGGGLYLIYLGIDSLRHREAHAVAMRTAGAQQPSAWRSMREGFLVGILNPKTLVFFAAVLPQFIDRDRSSVTAQLLLLGALFSLLALLSDGSWGILAGTARDWLAREPGRLVALRTVGGTVMFSLGLIIIVAAVRHSFS